MFAKTLVLCTISFAETLVAFFFNYFFFERLTRRANFENNVSFD